MAAQIITWHDKHGNRHYTANTPEDIHRSALRIVKERLDLDYFVYPDGAEGRAIAIVESGNGPAAWDFLQGRNEFEYERISVGEVR
jgi:hypothetical protein